jgi:TPR repeat protein
MYREGEGVNKDNSQALKYLRLAADDNYIQALHSMGYEYSLGEILHQENSKALEYLQKAAEYGNNFSAGTLGLLYYDGDYIVSRDYDKAFYYLHEAAGHPEEFGDEMLGTIFKDLAACYRFGRGTEVNHSLASYYTEQAAKCGDSSSFDAVNALRR